MCRSTSLSGARLGTLSLSKSLKWQRNKGRAALSGCTMLAGFLVAMLTHLRSVSPQDLEGKAKSWKKPLEIRIVEAPELSFVALSPDGTTLVYGAWRPQAGRRGDEGTTILYDLTTKTRIGRLMEHGEDNATGVVFSPCGKEIVVTRRSGPFELWDVKNRKMLLSYEVSNPAHSPIFSPDGKILAGIVRRPSEVSSICLWETSTGRRLRVLRHGVEDVSAYTFSQDGSLLLSENYADISHRTAHPEQPRVLITTHLWDVHTGRHLGRVGEEALWRGTSIPIGRSLGDLTAGISGFRILRSPTGVRLALPTCQPCVPKCDFLEEGNWVALRDPVTRDLLFRDRVAELAITSCGLSKDGTKLIAIGHYAQDNMKQRLLVWDVSNVTLKWGAVPQSRQIIKDFWEELASEDNRKAHRAICALSLYPEKTLALIQQQLHPIPRRTSTEISRLFDELDSGRFSIRARAQLELQRLGEQILPSLGAALATSSISLDARRRMIQLLDELKGSAPIPAETRRSLRALQILESLGERKAAKEVLASLATGAPEAWLTCEAKRCVERLHNRCATPR